MICGRVCVHGIQGTCVSVNCTGLLSPGCHQWKRSDFQKDTVSQTHAHSPSPSRGLQEMRECAVRGLDGPGLFALDVHPQSWAHLPGYEEALARRAADLEALKVLPRGL